MSRWVCNEHVTELNGLPVFTFPQNETEPALPGADAVAWRLDYNEHMAGAEDFEVYWERFTKLVELEKVRALIFGFGFYVLDDHDHDHDHDCIDCIDCGFVDDETLLGVKDRLVNLEALFLGDLEAKEAPLHLIGQSDLAPILDAFPQLRELSVRGNQNLEFPVARYENLRRLRFESGGLKAKVVRDVIAADLPTLEHLEMWLGDKDYDGDATVADLAPLLAGDGFPALRHLGLQNSEIQDEIAAAVASAPVVTQLKSLDLSMGTLTDTGAEALLYGRPLTHLASLNLSHHYLSDAMMLQVWDALEPAGVRVDLSEQQPEKYRTSPHP
ncbi:STM4015 family protein, partial [Streptomyces sp. 3N207]|uniref:STM4015 family protein n=1 Tax=Streptomyces sp. 3N207 TaxID=3457417 RepID=UPI003FD402EB